jgi:aminoglycoside 2''-phosphotransferase
VTSVEFNDRGQNSDVLVVDGDLIFRFPKYVHVLEQLQTEAAILQGARPYLSLNIPVPEFLNLDGQPVGKAFMGYRRIPGEPLWRDTFRAISTTERRHALAAQLGGFLRELHAIPVDEAIACDLPLSDTYEECADIYRRMRGKLFDHMRPDAREWATRHFEAFLDEPANFDYQPVLKHSDFGPSNILFDPERQGVTGIIDFGSAGLGDPAYDFAGLLSGYGEAFVQQCSRVYPAVTSFLDRTRFYQGTFALLEALFGIENDDPRAFKAGMARYV